MIPPATAPAFPPNRTIQHNYSSQIDADYGTRKPLPEFMPLGGGVRGPVTWALMALTVSPVLFANVFSAPLSSSTFVESRPSSGTLEVLSIRITSTVTLYTTRIDKQRMKCIGFFIQM